MDTVGANRIAKQLLGGPDAIPHTADWKQKPYFDDAVNFQRETATRNAEHQFEILAASMMMDLEVPING